MRDKQQSKIALNKKSIQLSEFGINGFDVGIKKKQVLLKREHNSRQVKLKDERKV